MNVFNSLGSNYDSQFVWQSIKTHGTKRDVGRLEAALSGHYGGQTALTYKGRQSLELALINSDLPRSSAIGINGFTCYALYEAVETAGYRPVLIDVAAGQLNFDEEELRRVHLDNKSLSAIIVQNTLGLVADMPALKQYCKTHKIVIIEDLAHSLGSKYSDGLEAGKVGEYTMLSFSQDKPLDVVAGGAIVNRQPGAKAFTPPGERISFFNRKINAFYPMWASLIRKLYPTGLGRYLHFCLKKLHLLATPMSDSLQGIQTMEPRATKLLLKKWAARSDEISHRLEIAKIYQAALPKGMQIEPLKNSSPLYLRFPLVVSDRPSLISYLKTKGIYIGDTWYDAPIGPKRYMSKTSYKSGQCPNSEKLAGSIINLPTHINVSEKSAKAIAREVNEWLKSQ